MKRATAFWPLITLMAVIKFFLPFVLQSPVFELQRDEFLYYEQGQHLAWGYMENPPLLSWMGTICGWLGGSAYELKACASLFGALTLIVACLITVEFGGRRFAQFITACGVITGAFMRVHSLFQPNVVDIFFWTLSAYCIIRYINSSSVKWIYFLGISLALGFLGKYSILFFGASIIVSLLLSRHRKLFAKKHIYIAALLALVIIAPNVLWQYNHNWPLVHHMQELHDTQLRYLNPDDFIKDQVLFLLPVVFVWITGLVWLFRDDEWRFLGFTYFLVILLLLLGRGKSYYSLGVYPVLLAAGARSLERWTLSKQWIRYAVTLVIILLTLPLVPLLLPLWKPDELVSFYKKAEIEKTGLLKWEDQRNHALPQDFADMLGWKELARKTENVYYLSLPDSVRAKTAIYCRNYGQAGALKFYGRHPEFKQKVFSDNGSFLLWIPDSVSFEHLLFVGRFLPDADDEVFNHFKRRIIMDSVTNPLSRQFGDKIILFRNADDQAAKLARQGLTQMKNRFRRS